MEIFETGSQAGLEFSESPASASPLLGLQTSTTMPSYRTLDSWWGGAVLQGRKEMVDVGP
jgi:hypothetical protein